MEPAEVLGIEHIDLTVNDLGRSAAFYDRVLGALGFKRLDEDDAGEHDIRWGNAHLTIAIRAAARCGLRSLSRRAASPGVEGQVARAGRRVPSIPAR